MKKFFVPRSSFLVLRDEGGLRNASTISRNPPPIPPSAFILFLYRLRVRFPSKLIRQRQEWNQRHAGDGEQARR
jgi:hypothetical protein